MSALPDYFALYNITPTLAPDPAVLRKKYYELSRQYHPDRFSGSDGAAQLKALTMSAQVNEGLRILSDEDARLGYVLLLEGVLETDENYKLPPQFLMEMMELNEAIGNVGMAPDMQPEAARELQSALENWENEVGPLRQRFNEGERDPGLLAGLKDYYFRKKYLQRIKERLL
jgi:molecular chaperone HscB